ncbi:SDR family oxidoreductase [Rhodococcus sp. JVH1]|uniref:SDR family oxidoreductase n=1 Tax=Rhodococcus sp. JVH1 TaxID=745408 RepID=UPI000271FEFA|nr:SDR family oxidoreductase [Rhodococcus sp. JVH1]EJI93338.1 3-alpha-(or 20-beta)-hydroxysteroid dehydrogenase domain protein [Rhodococcus sp. JVH1]
MESVDESSCHRRIINASSTAGLIGAAQHVLHGVSRGAVRLVSKHAAIEQAANNIRANSIHPTFTRSATADEAAIAAGTTLDE